MTGLVAEDALSGRVLWLGGSPCSGKSSIAQALARRYGAAVYHCDDHWQAHCALVTPEAQPQMWRASRMSWDELWGRDVASLLADELAIYAEEFPMIVADLRRQVQAHGLVIAEGAALLPGHVARHVADARQAIWLTPTEAFQRRIYPQRGPWVQQILAQCTEPDVAFARWMDRDIAFARHVAAQAEAAGLRALWVDGKSTLAENTRTVEEWFAPHLPPAGAPEEHGIG
jgi:hypothetical protein